MTDVKPFVRHASIPSGRSVAVLLVASGLDQSGGAPGPGLLQPFGPTCLFERALACLERVEEATERAVWADDAALLERYEAEPRAGLRLLAEPPDRCLRPGAADALLSSHVLVVDGRHPFLRPNTIDEAIRLLRVREDIESIVSCEHVCGRLFDLEGQPACDGRDGTMLLSNLALSVVPADTLALGRALTQSSFAFEIGHTEAFRVDTEFAHALATAWLNASGPRLDTDIPT